MSWNMIIFGYGFLLGGLSFALIFGIVSLLNQVSAEYGELRREPEQDTVYPLIYPPLTVLPGGKEQSYVKKAAS